MHSSILRKETLAKFGYDPKHLLPKSGKKVIFECHECGKHGIRPRGRVSALCEACTAVIRGMKMRRSAQPTNVRELMDFFFRAQIVVHTPGGQTYLRVGRKNLGKEKLNQMIALLALPADKLAAKSRFKEALRVHLLKSDQRELGAMLTYIFENHLTLSRKPQYNQIVYTVCDKRKIVSGICDKLGFIYRRCKANDAIVIKSGSFYVHGEWIHIG